MTSPTRTDTAESQPPYHLVQKRRLAGRPTTVHGASKAPATGSPCVPRGLRGAAAGTIPRGRGSAGGWQRFPSILCRHLLPAGALGVSRARAHLAATASSRPAPSLLPLFILSDPKFLVCVPILARKMLRHCPVEAPLQVVRHLGVLCRERRHRPPGAAPTGQAAPLSHTPGAAGQSEFLSRGVLG